MAQLALQTHFRNLKDPRRAPRHLLLDIVGIAICAVISGANDWQQIATFARQRHDWLRRFFKLPEGIPCHDTFERVFDCIDPRAFANAFSRWMQALAEVVGLRHIAIDGKTLRRSGSPTRALGPLHLVSAWATENSLVLGQVAVNGKSNEITAIPELLDLLELRGAFVTIDAMGCQKAIAKKIIERGGHYLLTVKENQEHLLEDIQQSFVDACEKDFAGMKQDTYETKESGHGRQEYRCYTVLHYTDGIRHKDDWAGLTTIGMCYSQRTIGAKTSEETRYFIGSKIAGARTYGKALRNHWGIENGLHWVLDVSFRDDDSRLRKDHGPENFALLRRLAASLLKNETTAKSGVGSKRKEAGWDNDYLLQVLAAVPQ